jgi:thioesterase domain-containing protein
MSLSILLEASTPRTLASAIADRNVSRLAQCLVAINEHGEPPAIFCVHGTGGQSVAPLRLSSVIGGRPFYAFRALGLEENEEIPITAEAIATSYIAGMEALRPGGRHVILGHCAGASIAYAMAQQLADAGRPAAGLILVDPEVGDEWAPFLYRSGLSLSVALAGWQKRGEQLSASIAAATNPNGEQRRSMVFGALRHAAAAFVPKPYQGPALLLCCPERKADLLNQKRGYPALLKDLKVVDLHVPHEQMFDEGLPVLADAVNGFVSGLAASVPGNPAPTQG